MDITYHFPPLTLFSDIRQDQSIEELNYEFLDEICSFVEEKLSERDLGYKLVGVEYAFNFTEFKFLDKSTYDERESIMSGLGYNSTTRFYADLEGEIIEHFGCKGIKVSSASTYRSNENAFCISVAHKHQKTLHLKNILEQCEKNDPNYYFCVRDGKKPHLLLGKQMQFVSLAAQNDEYVKQTIDCILTSFITLCSPADANLIVLSKDQSYDLYNKIPHLVFGEVIKDFKLYPAIYEYVIKQIELRKSLFEQEQAEDVYSYNQKTTNKISKLFVIIDDFGAVYDCFKDKWKDFLHDLSKTAKLGDKYGIYFLVVAPIDKNDVLIPLRYASNTKIAFKVNNPMTALNVLDNVNATNLLLSNDAYINAKYFLRSLNRVVTATVSKSEIESVCYFVRANNLCKDKKHLIEDLYVRCEELNKKQELTKEQGFLVLVKELVKQTLNLSHFSLIGASGIIKVDAAQTKKVVDYCLEKNYIAWYDKFNYKPILTKEEYKKIFND